MTEPETLPSIPWKKGIGEDYTAYVIEVHVCETKKEGIRMVYSHHGYQSDEDEEIARSLASAGEEQSAYGLILNAVRRECFIEALLLSQHDSDFLPRYQMADEEEKRDLEMELAAKTVTMISQLIRKIGPEVAREIMSNLIEK